MVPFSTRNLKARHCSTVKKDLHHLILTIFQFGIKTGLMLVYVNVRAIGKNKTVTHITWF